MAGTEQAEFTKSITRYGKSRTPYEFEVLLRDLQEAPRKWHIYSKHASMNAAYQRSKSTRRKRPPKALLPYLDKLEITATNLENEGPVVLIRWVG